MADPDEAVAIDQQCPDVVRALSGLHAAVKRATVLKAAQQAPRRADPETACAIADDGPDLNRSIGTRGDPQIDAPQRRGTLTVLEHEQPAVGARPDQPVF